MKDLLKELGYWLEGKIKDLCGELTPDKRITAILIMLLILVIGNLYFTISTIYNWGKENERKKHPEIEHIEQPELKHDKRKKLRRYDFMDSPVDRELFDLEHQRMKRDSMDRDSINKQRFKEFKEYERAIKTIYGTKAKA